MHIKLITFEDWETVRKYSKFYCVQAEAYEKNGFKWFWIEIQLGWVLKRPIYISF